MNREAKRLENNVMNAVGDTTSCNSRRYA